MGGDLSRPVMWSWDSGKQIPCFYVHCQVKHRLQAPTLVRSLTFHIGCPMVRMDRLPNFLRYGAWLMHFLCAHRVPLSLFINLRIKPLSFMFYKFLVQNKKIRESWFFQSCCLIIDPPPLPPPPAPKYFRGIIDHLGFVFLSKRFWINLC